jgi:hypothetical protein
LQGRKKSFVVLKSLKQGVGGQDGCGCKPALVNGQQDPISINNLVCWCMPVFPVIQESIGKGTQYEACISKKKQDPKGKFITFKQLCDNSLVVRYLPISVRA